MTGNTARHTHMSMGIMCMSGKPKSLPTQTTMITAIKRPFTILITTSSLQLPILVTMASTLTTNMGYQHKLTALTKCIIMWIYFHN